MGHEILCPGFFLSLLLGSLENCVSSSWSQSFSSGLLLYTLNLFVNLQVTVPELDFVYLSHLCRIYLCLVLRGCCSLTVACKMHLRPVFVRLEPQG